MMRSSIHRCFNKNKNRFLDDSHVALTTAIQFLIALLGLSSIDLVNAAAFRPPNVSEEFGCSPTLSFLFGRSSNDANSKKAAAVTSFYYFDPLEIANDGNFARLREAELKHGRVAMLAMTEIMVAPLLKGAGLLLPLDFSTGLLQGVETSCTFINAGKVFGVCLVLETLVFVQREPEAMPGDYGTGYFGIRDKGLNENSLLAELENGRLAMLAIMILFITEIVSGGESWDQQWLQVLTAWIKSWLPLDRAQIISELQQLEL